MEVVLSLVGGERHSFAVHQESGAAHAVGVAAHHGTEIGTVALIAADIIAAQDHVQAVHKKGHQRGTIICDIRPNSTTRYGVQPCLGTGGKFTKGFSHFLQAPFKSEESGPG